MQLDKFDEALNTITKNPLDTAYEIQSFLIKEIFVFI